MKKLLAYGAGTLLFLLQLHAQDGEVWTRIKEVNLPKESLQASWQRIYRSPLLQEEVYSEGVVYIKNPDRLRWETHKPSYRLTLADGTEPRGRFRLPREKDFKISVLEGEHYSIKLEPLRRDMKQLVGQIVLVVEKNTYKLLYVNIRGVDGDWTQLSFSNLVIDPPLPDSLFVKE